MKTKKELTKKAALEISRTIKSNAAAAKQMHELKIVKLKNDDDLNEVLTALKTQASIIDACLLCVTKSLTVQDIAAKLVDTKQYNNANDALKRIIRHKQDMTSRQSSRINMLNAIVISVNAKHKAEQGTIQE